MTEIYRETAQWFRDNGNNRPSRCDVRCFVNESLHRYEQDGFAVHYGYDQDRAFAAVRKHLGDLE